MKKFLFLVLASGLVLMACSQNQTPPQKVQKTFTEKFSNATKVKWDQEEQNEWEAEFKMNGNRMSATFDNSGNWMETETKIKEKNLPVNIKSVVDREFSGWEMEGAERIEKPGFSGYEMALEKGDTEKEVLVSDSGEVTVKKEQSEDEEGEDEEDD